ncbi:hypothetical protein [Eubacterium limosum]|uniref:hypothetical protein n=1 Tax=Eubacterium limosum TaxID=1736 RepID=UPI003710FEAF
MQPNRESLKKIVVLLAFIIVLVIVADILGEILILNSIRPIQDIEILSSEKEEKSIQNVGCSEEVKCQLMNLEGEANSNVIIDIPIQKISTVRKGSLIAQTYFVSLEDNNQSIEQGININDKLKSKVYITVYYAREPLGKLKIAAISSGWKPETEKIKKVYGYLYYHEYTNNKQISGTKEINGNDNYCLVITGFKRFGYRIDTTLWLSFIRNDNLDSGWNLKLDFSKFVK